jgi:D-aminoacyl-tRNA deacylase
MRALIQRVSSGGVTVEGQEPRRIGRGYVVLLGVGPADTAADAEFLAQKTVSLRIFPDDEGRMNRSLLEVGGAVLVIPQFTLYADTRKGNRPSFIGAAPPALADALYQSYIGYLRRALGDARVATGVFGAHMRVEIVNDGPVTILLQSARDALDAVKPQG